MTTGQNGKIVIADAIRFVCTQEGDLADRDGNGLDDAWERLLFLRQKGTDPHADQDQDGFDNLYEFLVGSDPTTISPPFRIDTLESDCQTDQLTLTWKSVVGRRYQLLRAESLVDGFLPFGDVITVQSEACSVALPKSGKSCFKIAVMR